MTGRQSLLADVAIRASLGDASRTRKEAWLTDARTRGAGVLALRVRPEGAGWYFRYTGPDCERERIAIGPYSGARTKDTRTGGGFTLQEARERVRELPAHLKSPETQDVRAHLDREAHEHRKEREDERRVQDRTLIALLDCYADHLSGQGKTSGASARSLFRSHVATPFPELAAMPAREVVRSDIVRILRGVTPSKSS